MNFNFTSTENEPLVFLTFSSAFPVEDDFKFKLGETVGTWELCCVLNATISERLSDVSWFSSSEPEFVDSVVTFLVGLTLPAPNKPWNGTMVKTDMWFSAHQKC